MPKTLYVPHLWATIGNNSVSLAVSLPRNWKRVGQNSKFRKHLVYSLDMDCITCWTSKHWQNWLCNLQHQLLWRQCSSLALESKHQQRDRLKIHHKMSLKVNWMNTWDCVDFKQDRRTAFLLIWKRSDPNVLRRDISRLRWENKLREPVIIQCKRSQCAYVSADSYLSVFGLCVEKGEVLNNNNYKAELLEKATNTTLVIGKRSPNKKGCNQRMEGIW